MASRSNLVTAGRPGAKTQRLTPRPQDLLFVLCVILCVFAVKNTAYAQTFPLQVQVNVLPPYSAYLQDYAGAGQRVQIFVRNTTQCPLRVRFNGTLTGDNGVVIATSPQYRPQQPLQLAPGENRLLSRADLEGLFDLGQIDVQGMDKNLLYRGLPLPDGNYQLCVRAFSEGTLGAPGTACSNRPAGQPLSAEFPLGCSAPIVVRSVEPPITISPLCESSVSPTVPQVLVFTWTPPVGVSPAQVDYTLRIVELPQEDVDPNVFIDAIALPKSGVEVRNLRINTFLYGPTQPPLQVGKRYAWRVQAIDRSRRLNFLNDGKSPVCVFTYGEADTFQSKLDSLKKAGVVMKVKSGNLPVKCSCQLDITDDVVDNSGVLQSRSATVAGFQVSLLDNVKEVDGKLNGDGMIPIPIVNSSYAKLRVRLYDVQCNAAGQVIGGVIRARYSDKANPSLKPNWDNPDYTPPVLTSDQISNISETLSENKDMLVSSLKNTVNSIGFEVPFGIDKQIGPVNTVIAITNVTFTPVNAYFDANTWIKTPGEWVSGIPLSGKNLCLSPEKPCGEGILYLASELKLTPYFALKGLDTFPPKGPWEMPDTTQITHVVFDVDGYKQLRVHAGLKPPGLVNAETKNPLEIGVNFGLVGADFSDWTAQFKFPEFYVTGLEDFKFSMDNNQPALYDHSETTTPGPLPTGYKPEAETNLWKGLYFPMLRLKLGGFFSKMAPSGKELASGVKNLIYDDQGLTGQAFLANLLGLGEGNLASWYASIDTVGVNFLKSSFKGSFMVGQVVLPIFKYKENMDQNSVWPWRCTLSKNENGGDMAYQFLISPKKDAAVDIWKAQLSLNENLTYITVGNKGGSFSAEAVLDGKVSINTGTFIAPGMTFHKLTLMSAAPYVKLDGLEASFASPQKDLAGMPFTLSNVGLSEAKKGQQVVAGQFDFGFTGNLDLVESAQLALSTTARVRFSAGLTGGRPDWQYVDFVVDRIKGNGTVGPMSADVDLEFYRDHPTYGNGFGGTAKLGIGFVGGLAVKARFGRTLETAGGFRYWSIGGTAVLPGGGIAIGTTPVAFKGFGGGAYQRMTQFTNDQGEIDYKPDNSTMLGFKAEVIVGTLGSNLLNISGALTIEFAEKLTPTLINIHGDAYLLANAPPAYGNELAKGTLDLKYNIADNVFDAQGSLTTLYSVGGFGIKAEARQVGLHIKPNQGRWFFSLGVPTNRNSLSILLGGKPTFTFGSYLLTGNDLPGDVGKLPPNPYGVSQSVLNDLNYSGMDVTPLISKGKNPMLAFGAGYSLPGNKYSVGPFFLDFEGALGYDLVLYNTDQACGRSLPGINGWYANGQLYAYLYFALGIEVDTWIYSGKIKALEVTAGALLEGGMVNPIWFHGNVLLRYNVLDGLVKGKVNMDFWYNKEGQCKPAYTPSNPFADLPLISRIGPSTSGDDKVSILTPLFAEFNYPVESWIEIDEQTPDGKELHRRFRIVYKKGERFGLQRTSKDGADAACTNDDGGWIKYSQSNEEDATNYAAYFYRNTVLSANAAYNLTVGVEVWHDDPKAGFNLYSYKGKPVEQSASVSFQTGPCLTSLTNEGGDNATVSFSYPFEGQRYFMKGDGSSGFIRLSAKMCCMDNLQSDKYYSLKVRFVPYKGGAFDSGKLGGALVADAKFTDNNRVTYNLPFGLQNSTLYRLELYREPTDLLIKEQQALEAQAKQKSVAVSTKNMFVGQTMNLASQTGLVAKAYVPGQDLGGLGQEVNSKARSLTEQTYRVQNQPVPVALNSIIYKEKYYDVANLNISVKEASSPDDYRKKYEQVIYSYYFKTSKFNQLKEKLAASSLQPLKQTVYPVQRNGYMVDNAYSIPFTAPERFDEYELLPRAVAGGVTLQPLVNYRAGASTDNPWFKDFVYPVFSNIFPYTSLEASLNGQTINTALDAANYMVVFDPANSAKPEPRLSKKALDELLIIKGVMQGFNQKQ